MKRSDDLRLPATRRRYLTIAQTLLTAIQQGRFQPGGKLPSDRELADQLGVSRPTAREALLALELIGAINVRHGDGTYISEMHHRFFDAAGLDFGSSPVEVMQARITVEPPVSGLLTGRASTEDLDGIQADIDAAAGMIDDLAALPAFVDLSLRFHGRLAALCENRILNHVVSELVDIDRQPLWALLNQMVLKSKQSRVTVLEEHQEILDIVRSGDPEAAERAMRAHLQANKRQLFMEDLADESAGSCGELAGEVRIPPVE